MSTQQDELKSAISNLEIILEVAGRAQEAINVAIASTNSALASAKEALSQASS